MRCLVRSNPWPCLALGLALATVPIAPPLALAQEARVTWKDSRFSGAPDPPPPFTVEPAFPSLRFDRPLVLSLVPGTTRLAVGEFTGKIFTFPNDPGTERRDLALDLAIARPDLTALYGLAFHPRFSENRQVFLCYVLKNDLPDGTRVSRFNVRRTEPPTIDPSSEEVIITWLSGGHNGGCLQFGPDGFLYISTGDGAGPSPPDPLATGQDVSDLLSSILRIDVDRRDSGRGYRVPPDNPLLHMPGARSEIWAYGLRNPWKMSFDRANGDLWLGDVGWELWELIDRVERGGNYGWSVREGRQPIRPDGKLGPSPILPPTVDHPHSEAASITGGYVYRGTRLKELAGTYVYGDYQSGKVWGLRHDGQKVSWRGELADTGLRLVAFGEDRAGELFLVEYERSNQIYRLVPNPARQASRDFPRTLSASGLFAATKDHALAPGVIAYTINARAWADGAQGERLLAIPGAGRIALGPDGHWLPPDGTVLAKTVSLKFVAGDPASRRRLETQVLHLEAGSWRPYTYVWNDAQTDAALADAGGSTRTFRVRDDRAPGGEREIDYRFAARTECVLCHNPWVASQTTVFGRQSASPLAFNAEQLNRESAGENQLRSLERRGVFSAPLPADSARRLADPYDTSAGLDARARAYLQVNCSHCHQFNAGGAADILLSAALPMEQTKTLNQRPNQGDFGIADARIIVPGEPERSVLFYRIVKSGPGRMPRTGSHRVDPTAARLISDWIANMPGPRANDARDSTALSVLRTTPEAPATARAEAIGRLTDSTRGALALVRAIDAGTLTESSRAEVVARAKDNPRAEIRDLIDRYVPDSQRIKRLGDTIDPAVLLALPGEARRGREWFAASSSQCKSCHRVGDVGTEVGPDLTTIGAKYSKADLLRHLVEPSRAVDPKYAAHTVATRDGRIIIGVVVEKTARRLVLRDAKAQTIPIPLADVEQEITQSASLMPEGLLRDLTAQQAADLLEFLGTLKGP